MAGDHPILHAANEMQFRPIQSFWGREMGERAVKGVAQAGNPPIPTLAVASGHRVLIFRNMRPSMQYRLPPIEIDATEARIWEERAKICNMFGYLCACVCIHGPCYYILCICINIMHNYM